MTDTLSVPVPEKISDLMRRLMDKATHGETVSVGHILKIFGVRGFAFLILVLALLNIVIFMVPLISILFGLPMVILSVQLLLGMRTPIFPRVIRQRTLPTETLIKGLDQVIFAMEKIERYIKPRLVVLTAPHLVRAHGLLALVLAMMVTLPIPLFNVPPALGLAFLAIGLLQRDGVFIVLAYATGFWCVLLFGSLGHFAEKLTH